MKLESFGFEPVHGKEYVVTFTNEGELLSTSVYNGSPLPSVNFPDNAKIGFTVTDKETGKQLMSTDFISYNGKLYKSVFNLPLKDPDSNMNANIYIKDLHYDLTTGSVLIQVQGFQGDEYQLNVSDTTVQHKVLATPITLQDDMYYSIPTELVQGNEFEVTLQDQHGKAIDSQVFTAPISTDWRFTDSLDIDEDQEGEQEDEEGGLPEEGDQEQQQPDGTPPPGMPGQEQGQEVQTEAGTLLPDAVAPYQKPLIFGGFGLAALLVVVLLVRFMKRRKAKKEWDAHEEYQGDEEEQWEDESEVPDWVPEEEDGEEEEEGEYETEDEEDFEDLGDFEAVDEESEKPRGKRKFGRRKG